MASEIDQFVVEYGSREPQVGCVFLGRQGDRDKETVVASAAFWSLSRQFLPVGIYAIPIINALDALARAVDFLFSCVRGANQLT